MARIPFSFYSVLGNTFALVDEAAGPGPSEAEKSRFAHLACRDGHGIGADNLLALQRAVPAVLADIRRHRGYPPQAPTAGNGGPTPFVFRMFEPDGSEALCCGNGLLAMARHLDLFYGLAAASILTELPAGEPVARAIGRGEAPGCYSADMDAPRAMPEGFLPPGFIARDAGVFGRFRNFSAPDPADGRGEAALHLSGYAVYTGEPHLVFLEQAAGTADAPDAPDAPDTKDARRIFAQLFDSPSRPCPGPDPSRCRRESVALLRALGLAANSRSPGLFPRGINLVFARVTDTAGVLEYRCFERGIRKETLACGTGAVAAAALAHHLGLVAGPRVTARPVRCAWANPGPDTALTLTRRPGGAWTLTGRPVLVYRAWADQPAGPVA